ncbi:MAG TPA: VWA domain-containing protein [Kofleriaceae bacterium]|nr:VWA domain-containing protein [Kofleriaceae bacterium]
MTRLVRGLVVVLAVVSACKKETAPTQETGQKPAVSVAVPPITLKIAYSSEKKAWMEEAVAAYERDNPKLPNGKPIKIEAKSYGSGEAATAIIDGSFQAHVYSPASAAYIAIINQQWLTSHPKALVPAGDPVVLSPIVIAMWKPMAEALGWPTKDIGWKEVIRVSKDPKGWGSLGHPEWGAFKLGHTHPEFSNSGLLAVLAEAFAGAGKTRGLERTDLDAKATQDYLGAIENAVVHYGKSTSLFTDKMLETGPGYMSACVTYENLVIESYGKTTQAPFPLVSIYPVEGTFWSDHPYSILDAEWVGADERAAAQAFLAYLKSKPMQLRALALGFRPADSSIPINAPVDAAHGADAKQPETLLELPNGQVLDHLLEVWRKEKKSADVMFVFDRSGSMRGDPLREAKAGAQAFLDGLGDRDSVSILFFDDKVGDPTPPALLGTSREKLKKQVESVFADGGTSLYDAISTGYAAVLARAKKEPGRIHAMVVMTDGNDENSTMKLEELQKKFNPENAPVKIFTIAYGEKADATVLEEIAKSAQGTNVKGTADTIVQVYRDMSAFF